MSSSRVKFVRRLGALTLAAAAVLVAVPLLMPPAVARQDAEIPYVPTPAEVVEGMLDLAEVQPDDRLVDLGSGDGRIAIAAARRGARTLGVERNARLVSRARTLAEMAGVADRARFVRDDLFTISVRDADVVTLYLLPEVNVRLRPKLLTEMRPGSRVVSHAFDMGDWPPDAHRVIAGKNVYLWTVPAVAGGQWRLSRAGGTTTLLEIDQRYGRISGRMDGVPLTDARLVGATLRFTVAGERYHAIVGDRTLSPDPDMPAGATTGWQAERAD